MGNAAPTKVRTGDFKSSEDQDAFREADRHYRRRNFEDALQGFSRLAEKGYADCSVFVGWMHYAGVGTGKDPAAALEWFRSAAELGSIEGMFYCGRLLATSGRYEEANGYLQASAAKGYAPAMCRLGLMYLSGRGVSENRDFAMSYLRRAADAGNVFAKRELAVQAIQSSSPLSVRAAAIGRFVMVIIEGMAIAFFNRHSERIRA